MVIFIFDTWGYEETFETRKADFQLPEIRRLAGESITFRSKAFGSNTLLAIPALMTGKPLKELRPTRGIDLELRFQGKQRWVRFSRQKTVLNDVAEAGGNVALVGTGYHPLCYLFRRAVAHCAGMGYWPKRTDETILSRIDDIIRGVFSQFPGVLRIVRTLSPKRHPLAAADGFLRTVDQIETALTDSRHQLVYVHLILPHAPYIYDRRTDKFIPPTTDPEYYFDALELVDWTIGRIRHTMKKIGRGAGPWRSSLPITDTTVTCPSSSICLVPKLHVQPKPLSPTGCANWSTAI
ncbi:hypothetical protein OAJ57_02880 [Alphaproteobacteria bacterium]|nr:hypothetical protein [Alphaproteobacteria bacterium]